MVRLRGCVAINLESVIEVNDLAEVLQPEVKFVRFVLDEEFVRYALGGHECLVFEGRLSVLVVVVGPLYIYHFLEVDVNDLVVRIRFICFV